MRIANKFSFGTLVSKGKKKLERGGNFLNVLFKEEKFLN